MKSIQVKYGDRYGKLTVVHEVPKRGNKRFFRCSCDCGKDTTVRLDLLRNGHTKSCGCIPHSGNPNGNPVHGLRYHPLYRVWHNMKARCYNPNNKRFHRYGNRGIKVCDEWINNLQKFIDDMYPTYQDGLTIDRIDNDGNYELSNCKWSTYEEQANNRLKCNGSTYRIKLDISIKITVVR